MSHSAIYNKKMNTYWHCINVTHKKSKTKNLPKQNISKICLALIVFIKFIWFTWIYVICNFISIQCYTSCVMVYIIYLQQNQRPLSIIRILTILLLQLSLREMVYVVLYILSFNWRSFYGGLDKLVATRTILKLQKTVTLFQLF